MKRRGGRGALDEYDLHPGGMRVDDALAKLDRIVSDARRRGGGVFAVVTGYGSSGGTAKIKSAVLAACRQYVRQRHIRGFLDGEFAGDPLSDACLSFPEAARLPVACRRSPNPGVVFVSV